MKIFAFLEIYQAEVGASPVGHWIQGQGSSSTPHSIEHTDFQGHLHPSRGCLQDALWQNGVATCTTLLWLQGSTSCLWKLGNLHFKSWAAQPHSGQAFSQGRWICQERSLFQVYQTWTLVKRISREQGQRQEQQWHERAKDVKSWKSTLPPSGAPQVKQVNRRTFNWCPSCKRWTTTHTTATHTGSKKGTDGTNGGECNQQCFTHFWSISMDLWKQGYSRCGWWLSWSTQGVFVCWRHDDEKNAYILWWHQGISAKGLTPNPYTQPEFLGSLDRHYCKHPWNHLWPTGIVDFAKWNLPAFLALLKLLQAPPYAYSEIISGLRR